MYLHLYFVYKANVCLDCQVSPACDSSLAENAQRVSQFWRHLTPAAFECSFKARLAEYFSPYIPVLSTEPPLTVLHLLSSSFPWCFSISRLPLCPSPLTPPPCCTPCSLTLPARRLEIELDSVLTPVRAREQETNGVSGESRQPASSVSGWNNGIRLVVVCRCVKVPDQTFLNYSMCNIKLNSSLHTKLQLIHILTYISEFN